MVLHVHLGRPWCRTIGGRMIRPCPTRLTKHMSSRRRKSCAMSSSQQSVGSKEQSSEQSMASSLGTLRPWASMIGHNAPCSSATAPRANAEPSRAALRAGAHPENHVHASLLRAQHSSAALRTAGVSQFAHSLYK